MTRAFVVYTLSEESSGRIFYVGKTNVPNKRLVRHLWEAAKGSQTRRCLTIRAILSAGGSVILTTVYRAADEADAFSKERELIDLLGRDRLTNETDGGGGFSGVARSDEWRAKISASLAISNQRPETRAKRSEAALKRAPASDETRAKLSAASSNPSPETRARIAEAQRRRAPASEALRAKRSVNSRNISDETRAKLSAGQRNRPPRPPISEETRARIAAAARNRPPVSAETRAKLSAANRVRWARAREAEDHPCRRRGRHWSAAHGCWCAWSEEAGACLPVPRLQTDDDDLPF